MKKAHFCYPIDGGCGFHRHLQPARFCSDKFKDHGWNLEIGAGLPSDADVLFWHGLPMDADTTSILLLAMTNPKCKFVWSVDDDWLTVPDWNPAKPGQVSMAMYHVIKKMADYILVSTPELAETFADVNEKVLICPNMIDISQFPPIETREDDKGRYPVMQAPKGPVRIVWSGGPTHSKDIEVLTEALDMILSKYGQEKCVVLFNGMSPPPKLMTKYLHRGIYHQPMVPFSSYQKVLNSMESHIYLAPQATVPFNLSKSNLRIMEAWGLRAVPVATSWGEYNCIENGKDGRLVPNEPDAWYSAILRLITDHETRIQMALQGYCRVDAKYNWCREECRKSWYSALSKILDVRLEL